MSVGYNVKISDITEQPSTLNRGKTLYVGGDGEGNYSKIQDAIDNASDGDTVFVYDDSSPYYESVDVYKSINLTGEDRDRTFIDGGYSGDVVSISVDWVYISGFTIQNSGLVWDDAGVDILSNYNTITGNTISLNNDDGVELSKSNRNTITDNNIISNNRHGIGLYGDRNTITGNTISLNKENGIFLHGSSNNTIKGNIISNNGLGIELYESSGNTIFKNNFINNGENAYDECDNIWDDGKYGNYWSDYKEKYPDAKKRLLRPWMWNTPYEIPGGDNRDMCPLVKQWPYSKPRIISRDTASYSSYLLRLLEQFPILHRLLSL